MQDGAGNLNTVKGLLISTLLVLQLLTQSASSTASPDEDIAFADALWGPVDAPIEVTPGDKSAPLTVILLNVGRDTIKGITGVLNLPSGFTNTSIPSGGTVKTTYQGSVVSGGSFTLRFLVNIGEGISVSNYRAALNVKYTRASGEERTADVEVHFKVTGRSVIKAEIQNNILIPKANNELKIVVSNIGTTIASNLDITLVLPSSPSSAESPLLLVDEDGHWTVNLLEPGASMPLSFTLYASASAAGHSYELPLTVTYRNSYGNIQSAQRSLGVRVTDPEAEKITIEASLLGSVLTPGSENELILIIHNIGTASASELDITLSLPQTQVPPFAFATGDGHWKLDKLNQDGKASFTFTLYASISAANTVHQLPLTITYKDQYGNSKTVSRTLGVRVANPEIDKISIQAALQNQILTPGSENILILTLRNNGAKAARILDITLSLPTAAVAPFAFTDTDGHWILNYLEPGRTASIRFSVFASTTSANNVYQLPLTITYYDSYGNPQTATRALGVKVASVETEKHSFEASLLESVLSPGSSNNLTLTILNTGREPAYNLELTLSLPTTPEAPFAYIGTDGHWTITSLRPGERVQFKFSLYASSSAANTAQQLSLTIAFKDKDGNPKTIIKSVGATVAATKATKGVTVTSSGFLTAGLLDRLNITLKNDLQTTIRNITITLTSSSPSATLVGARRWHLPAVSLKGVERIEVPVYASSSAAGGAVSFLVDVQYTGEGGIIRTESETLGVYVQGLIKLRTYGVAFTRIGRSMAIIGNILNEGNVDALFTTISIATRPTSPFKAEDTIYLGDLNPDAPLPFSINVEFTRNLTSPETVPITITAKYKDSLRVEHTERFDTNVIVTPLTTQEKPLTISPSTITQILSQPAVGLAVLIVIMTLILFTALRRHQARKASIPRSSP